MEEKNLQLDRMVFFCDAVVAIAITLLALDLKIDLPKESHLSFENVTSQWRNFAAFTLSFINIAGFWRNHHTFFGYFKKIDEKVIWFNLAWLFFITLLPFSTSLLGSHFGDVAAIFIYSLNCFIIACFQNLIWDYTTGKPAYIKRDILDDEMLYHLRLFCNLDMINGLVAVVVSCFYPTFAFILLFTKIPVIIIARIFYKETFGKMEHRKTGKRRFF